MPDLTPSDETADLIASYVRRMDTAIAERDQARAYADALKTTSDRRVAELHATAERLATQLAAMRRLATDLVKEADVAPPQDEHTGQDTEEAHTTGYADAQREAAARILAVLVR